MNGLQIWEILVPAFSNNGNAWPVDHHRAWDSHVKALTGGLTICQAVIGQWINKGEGPPYDVREKMIPVRVACTWSILQAVLGFTLAHYQQREVMAYKISDEVIFYG